MDTVDRSTTLIPTHETLTFDSVKESSREAAYEEIARHFAGPMSKHPVISLKGHPEVIWVRPDMGVASVANPVAFGLGSAPASIPWQEVKRSLSSGYLPIVISSWSRGPLLLTQTSFASLIGARSVETGHERQVAIISMTIKNIDVSRSRHEILWAFVPCAIAAKGVPPFPYNTYDLFEVQGRLPNVEGPTGEPRDNLIERAGRAIGLFLADQGVQTLAFDNGLRFELDLRPGEAKSVHLIVASSARGLTADDIKAVRQLDPESALRQAVRDLESLLASGTQIEVPEEIVNRIYKAQILHSQSQLLQAADKDYRLIVQGFQGVWPWEVMKFAVHWDSLGFHDDVRKCLKYFLRIQGRFPPHGDFRNSDAVFGGTIAFEESGWEGDDSTFYGQLAKLNAGKEGEFPNWMNGTGAMLHAFATHYRYTRDRAWLEQIAPAIVRACDWMIDERRATKKYDDTGVKVLHFGLLPIGRAYDTAEEAIRQLSAEGELADGEVDDRHAPLDTYYPCWTDSYSSQGLTSIAEALSDVGHADAPRLLSEARAYREDILEVMRRTRTSADDLPPYPERLYRPPAWAEFATGALAYLDTGFMQPGDEAFEQLECYMKRKWNRGILGLTGGMEKDGDPHGSNSFYVNFSEDIWHRSWLLRGETEKALLAFYSMLAYGLDRQTLASVERFHLDEPRYAPFFLDTSASARISGLIRQTLLIEDGNVLRLLPGVPRRWLESGKRIRIAGGVTTRAKLNLELNSKVEQGRIAIQLELSELRGSELDELRLRVPHPLKARMQSVRLAGRPWTRFHAEEEIVEFGPRAGVTEIEVIY